MEIVINRCYGGFSLSERAWEELRKKKNKFALGEDEHKSKFTNDFYCRDIPRDDPDLVKVVKKLGKAANGGCAELDIVTIPDDVEWEIDEYDGMEHVAEKHRTWY